MEVPAVGEAGGYTVIINYFNLSLSYLAFRRGCLLCGNDVV